MEIPRDLLVCVVIFIQTFAPVDLPEDLISCKGLLVVVSNAHTPGKCLIEDVTSVADTSAGHDYRVTLLIRNSTPPPWTAMTRDSPTVES